MNDNESYVKLFRKFEKWEWYTDVNTTKLFIHCLLKANWKDGNFRGNEIKRGSFLTSTEKLARESGLSIQNVKTAIKHLQLTNEITKEKMLNGALITVINYDVYQQDNKQDNQRNNKLLTNNQPTTNQRLTTIEEYKELKEVKEVKEYIDKFSNELEKTIIEFILFRADMKKPILKKSFIAWLDKLLKLGKTDEDRIQILKNSIANSWQGIFELKNKSHTKKQDVLPEYFKKGDWEGLDDI